MGPALHTEQKRDEDIKAANNSLSKKAPSSSANNDGPKENGEKGRTWEHMVDLM